MISNGVCEGGGTSIDRNVTRKAIPVNSCARKKGCRKDNGVYKWAQVLKVEMASASICVCWGSNVRGHAHQAVEKLMK